MQLVLPITTFDTPLFAKLVDVLEFHGHLETFDIVLAPSMNARHIAEAHLDRMLLLGRSAFILNVDYEEGANQWPLGPNKHWVQTVYALDALVPEGMAGDCWFWMEPDCFPIFKDWARQLAMAYGKAHSEAKANKRENYFLGKVVDTPHRHPQTKEIIFHPNGYEDQMMMGCAVYPSGMSKNNTWRVNATGLMTDPIPTMPDVPKTQGWDIELRAFFKSSGWTNTNLIGDRWNTEKYRMEDGSLVCDAAPSPFRGRSHADTDLEGSAIIHGCKDTSLAELILKGTFVQGLPPTKSVLITPPAKIEAPKEVTPPFQPQKVTPVVSPQTFTTPGGNQIETPKVGPDPLAGLAESIGKLAELMERGFSTMGSRIETLEKAPQITRENAEAVHHVMTKAADGAPDDLLTKIREVVTGTQSYRPAVVAEKCKSRVESILKVIEALPEEFEVSGPAKWIKLKKAA